MIVLVFQTTESVACVLRFKHKCFAFDKYYPVTVSACDMFGPFRTSVLKENDITSSYVARPKHNLVGSSPFNARLGEDYIFWRSNRKSRDELISMEFNKKVQFEMVSKFFIYVVTDL